MDFQDANEEGEPYIEIPRINIFTLAAKVEQTSADQLKGYCDVAPEEYITATINSISRKKYTPLHVAIFNRNIFMFRELVLRGADLSIACHQTPCLHLLLHTRALPLGKDFADACIAIVLDSDQFDSSYLTEKDDLGYSVLHWAAEFNFPDLISLFVSKFENDLVVKSQILEAKDRTLFRPIHKACKKNHLEVLMLLIDLGAQHDASCVTSLGMNIMHIAASYGATGVTKFLESKPFSKDLATATNKFGRTPLDIKKLVTVDTKLHNTAIITDVACLNHHTCPPSSLNSMSAPPENIRRLEVLINDTKGCLMQSDLAPRVNISRNAPPATISDVLRVHEWSYVRNLQSRCDALQGDANEPSGMGLVDGDTSISRGSFQAALHAAGAGIHGVDQVMDGRATNVFCPVRPPGHHAGPKGAVKNEFGVESHGFCFLNNVSISAAYAMNRYRDKVKRVAIVDFDVHHGNGTEETVRWLKPTLEEIPIVSPLAFGQVCIPKYKPWFDVSDSENVLFVSVHGYGPRDRETEDPRPTFYPGSGKTVIPDMPQDAQSLDGLSKGGLESTSALYGDKSDHDDDDDDEEEDEEEVVGGTGMSEEGSNKPEEDDDDDDDDDDDEFELNSTDLANAEAFDDDSSEGSFGSNVGSNKWIKKQKSVYSKGLNRVDPLILDIGVPLPESEEVSNAEYRHMWRNYFRDRIFPSLLEFRPDFIFISAGFDAHKKDGINSGYIALVEDDFEWVTNHLVRIANTVCDGRIVSVLEGGYELNAEMCSAFAKSVKTHVAALAHGASSRLPFDFEDVKTEKAIEQQVFQDIKDRKLKKQQDLLMARQLALNAQTLDAIFDGNNLGSSSANNSTSNNGNSISSNSNSSSSGNTNNDSSSNSSSNSNSSAMNVAEAEASDRSKRKRGAVDYKALNEQLEREKAAAGIP